MLPEELLVSVVEYLDAFRVFIPKKPQALHRSMPTHYTPASRELAAFSLVNQQFRRICVPFLFAYVECRGSEKLEKLNEQCGDIPTVVNSVRLAILHLTGMSQSSEVCAIIGHLLPSFSSLQWLDLEKIHFDAALLENIHTHPTLTAAIVFRQPSHLSSSPLSKIIQRTKTVGRQGDFPGLESMLNRGMQLQKLTITGNMSETVIGQLRIPHLRKLEISGSYAKLHSWLLEFVNNHPDLSKITFKDNHAVVEQNLRRRHLSIPFLTPFFEAVIENKLDDVFLRKFTIARQPAQSGPEFKGWDVKGLAILVDQSLPDVVRIASTLFPQVTKLTLDVDNMDTFSATLEVAMRWYILRLADKVPSLEAIYVKELGKDDPQQFWEWEFEGWYLPRRKLLVDGGGTELVGSARLELP
ncbi:hypothetical protein C8J56DRAFT_923769 [Mycena floridula]|nr:hypothetical protein C8J56DRAFT_923769 [Mycena floridula]